MMDWMIRRRDVLGACAAGAAATGLGSFLLRMPRAHHGVTLVEESAVPESRQFASALAVGGSVDKVIRIDRSLNGLLEELEAPVGMIVGLTSDPAAMIAGMVLSHRGAYSRLLWQHHYTDSRWVHQTVGEARLLEAAAHDWPVAVAQKLRDAVDGRSEPSANICTSAECSLPDSSPGMLTSWVYELEGHRS